MHDIYTWYSTPESIENLQMCRPYLVSCSFSICEREVVLGVRLAPQGTLTARLAFLLCTLVVSVTSVDFL